MVQRERWGYNEEDTMSSVPKSISLFWYLWTMEENYIQMRAERQAFMRNCDTQSPLLGSHSQIQKTTWEWEVFSHPTLRHLNISMASFRSSVQQPGLSIGCGSLPRCLRKAASASETQQSPLCNWQKSNDPWWIQTLRTHVRAERRTSNFVWGYRNDSRGC